DCDPSAVLSCCLICESVFANAGSSVRSTPNLIISSGANSAICALASSPAAPSPTMSIGAPSSIAACAAAYWSASAGPATISCELLGSFFPASAGKKYCAALLPEASASESDLGESTAKLGAFELFCDAEYCESPEFSSELKTLQEATIKAAATVATTARPRRRTCRCPAG